MQEFVPGQRWINDAQLHMGLGSVLKTDFRTVTVIFLATGETFVYSKESVPLTRVRFVVGDHIITHEDIALEVTDVSEHQGLITYSGRDQSGQIHQLDESLLSYFIQLNRPSERLFNGQIDRDTWFELRYQTRKLQTQLAYNPLRGLIGGRVSLIPHQLYIAHTVANRYAPRVLLADEVGLGKTIEAGMILHQQLVTERARRVLIVVPESLVHQWLVEMLRRFNLMFKIFDAERYASLIEINDDEIDDESVKQAESKSDVRTDEVLNPFQTEQLVLCSIEFLSSQPDIFKQCRDGEWDLMVVDEAHHLQWSEQDPGFEYQLIDQLAQKTKGVLLLTATPEQLGKSSHYARLRLLDPVRFPSYAEFVEEEARYKPIADVMESLLGDATIDEKLIKNIQRILGKDQANDQLEKLKSKTDKSTDSDPNYEQDRESLVQMLLDRHGTGRVLFRNTRNTVQGFPDRVVTAYPLEAPEAYTDLLESFEDRPLSEAQLLLCPELLFQAADEWGENWKNIDPRVDQLAKILKSISPKKALVITASADTVLDLAEVLRVKQGIDAAVFHEGMSLLERDRAAAWFADQESGTQVLICSEIGSEGRNFQFAHNLVLFDLPLNPDLLEQRIGRLDRIGQNQTIHIHVVYLENTAQQILFDWYHHGLDAFQKTCPTGYQVFTQLEHDVLDRLHQPNKDYSQLIEATAALHNQHTEALQKGRDRLLEYNSCRPLVANQIKADSLEQDNSSQLQSYMETVFDCFGVDYEIHSEGCYAINVGTHMLAPFPHLPEDGMTITYDREIALTFEDVDYLSWDHPLVTSAMELVQTGELGNTAVAAVPIPDVKRGTIVLESIFILETASSSQTHSDRYLPPTTIRVMIDQMGKRLDQHPSYRTMDNKGEKLKRDMAKRIIKTKESLLRKMVEASEKYAQKLAPKILDAAREKSTTTLSTEIERLKALHAVNPNVRQVEIDYYKNQLAVINQKLDDSRLRLDAIRVIVAT